MKKAVSILLTLTVLLSCVMASGFSVFAAADHTGSTFLVYGDSVQDLSLSERMMTDNGDGTYSFPYHIEKDEFVSVNVRELKADGSSRSFPNGYYYKTFDFSTNMTQDITIVLNPDVYPYFSVEGENIRPRYGDYFYVYCDFVGQSQFSREDGLMTADENGLYSVTYKNVQPCDAIFDVYIEYSGEQLLGFYGYNVYPAKITEPCDVTVYFQPAYSDGFHVPTPDYYYDYGYMAADCLNSDCQIWATGDHLVPSHHVTLENVRFNYGKYPAEKAAENVYDTVLQNVKSDVQDYYWAEAQNPGIEMFYVGRGLTYPVEISETTEIDAKLYPIHYTTDPIVFHSPYQYTNIKWTLDATNLDYVTKEGAKFRFELIDMVKDVNMDGGYTIDDATVLQRGLAEFEALSDNQKIAADINGDGKVNVSDVTALQRYLAGFEKYC